MHERTTPSRSRCHRSVEKLLSHPVTALLTFTKCVNMADQIKSEDDQAAPQGKMDCRPSCSPKSAPPLDVAAALHRGRYRTEKRGRLNSSISPPGARLRCDRRSPPINPGRHGHHRTGTKRTAHRLMHAHSPQAHACVRPRHGDEAASSQWSGGRRSESATRKQTGITPTGSGALLLSGGRRSTRSHHREQQ